MKEVIEKILMILDFQMEKPTMYGWFHLLCCFIMILVIVLLCMKYKNSSGKKIILICSIMCLLFEVYKQINFSFNYDSVKIWWEYQWYAFPFQFCSTPMYVGLIAGLTKNKRLEYACYSFLATYGLIGGLAVMIYPSTVFIGTMGINIQTMVHHGIMVIMGMYLLVTGKVKPNFKTMLSAFYVFLGLVIMALIGNIVTYYVGIDGGLALFYISPFHTSSLPVFSIIYENVNYIIFLLSYIIIFSLGCSATLGIRKLFK